jgi:hypothetical protein
VNVWILRVASAIFAKENNIERIIKQSKIEKYTSFAGCLDKKDNDQFEGNLYLLHTLMLNVLLIIYFTA